MKLEFTKKQLIVAVAAVAVIALSFVGGYFVGFGSGVKSTENPKGNGEHFYMECYKGSSPSSYDTADQLLYHSTLDCPNILTGATIDSFGIYYVRTKRRVPYFFCSKCMNEELINQCERRIRNNYPDDIED